MNITAAESSVKSCREYPVVSESCIQAQVIYHRSANRLKVEDEWSGSWQLLKVDLREYNHHMTRSKKATALVPACQLLLNFTASIRKFPCHVTCCSVQPKCEMLPQAKNTPNQAPGGSASVLAVIIIYTHMCYALCTSTVSC